MAGIVTEEALTQGPLVIDEAPMREPLEAMRVPARGEEFARQQAIKQIRRRHQFHFELLISAIVMAVVAVSWAVAEYNNAGGWPTNGFSQSSGIHDLWNIWIIYPLMAWVLFLAVRSRAYYRGTSISEREIQREMERQAHTLMPDRAGTWNTGQANASGRRSDVGAESGRPAGSVAG